MKTGEAGKGDDRRPMKISPKEFRDRWNLIFGEKDDTQKHDSCGKQLHTRSAEERITNRM